MKIPSRQQPARKNLIGARVRQARMRAQLTQQKLAEQVTSFGASIDRAGITKIESGFRHVRDFELLILPKTR